MGRGLSYFSLTLLAGMLLGCEPKSTQEQTPPSSIEETFNKKDEHLQTTATPSLDQLIQQGLQNILKEDYATARQVLKSKTYEDQLNALRKSPDNFKLYADIREQILKRAGIESPPKDAQALDEILDYAAQYITRGNWEKAKMFLKSPAYDNYLFSLQSDNSPLFDYYADVRNLLLDRAKGNPGSIPSTTKGREDAHKK